MISCAVFLVLLSNASFASNRDSVTLGFGRRAFGCAVALTIAAIHVAGRTLDSPEYARTAANRELDRMIGLSFTPDHVSRYLVFKTSDLTVGRTRGFFERLLDVGLRRGTSVKRLTPIIALVDGLGGVESWRVIKRRGHDVESEAQLPHGMRLNVRSNLILDISLRVQARAVTNMVYLPRTATPLETMAMSIRPGGPAAAFNEYLESILTRIVAPTREVVFTFSDESGSQLQLIFENGRFVEAFRHPGASLL